MSENRKSLVVRDYNGNGIKNVNIQSLSINLDSSKNAITTMQHGGMPVNLSDCSDTKIVSEKVLRTELLKSQPQRIKPNGLIYGAVVHTSGYTFTVSKCKYYIDGIEINTAEKLITLSPADNTYDRFVVITGSKYGVIDVVYGAATEYPVKPEIPVEYNVVIASIYVKANSTVPSEIVKTIIYDENTEWAFEKLDDCNYSLINSQSPYRGSKYMNVRPQPNQPLDFIFTFYKNIETYIGNGELIFRIKLKTAIYKPAILQVGIGISFVTNAVNIENNNIYGLDFTKTDWQTVVVPISDFNSELEFIKLVGFKGSMPLPLTSIDFDAIEIQTGNNNNNITIELTGAIKGKGNNIIPVSFIDSIDFTVTGFAYEQNTSKLIDIYAPYRYIIKQVVLMTNTGSVISAEILNYSKDSSIVTNVSFGTSVHIINITNNAFVEKGDKLGFNSGTSFGSLPNIIYGKLIIERY